jgi:hypothetical protein
MKNQYHFWKSFPTYEHLVPRGFSAYSMTNFAHSIGRRPIKNTKQKTIFDRIYRIYRSFLSSLTELRKGKSGKAEDNPVYPVK